MNFLVISKSFIFLNDKNLGPKKNLYTKLQIVIFWVYTIRIAKLAVANFLHSILPAKVAEVNFNN